MRYPELWMPGWVAQVILTLTGLVFLFRERNEIAIELLIGAIIVGVVRSVGGRIVEELRDTQNVDL